MAKAFVIFHDKGFHILSFLLKQGFKHCAVVIESGEQWILIDPKAGLPQVQTVSEEEINELIDYTIIATTCRDVKIEGPFLLNNCVGLVKKLLGISNPFILTPHQLWRYLNVHITR